MPSIAKSWPLSALGVVPGATLTTRSDGATERGAGGLVGELSLTLLHKLPFSKFPFKEFHAVLVGPRTQTEIVKDFYFFLQG